MKFNMVCIKSYQKNKNLKDLNYGLWGFLWSHFPALVFLLWFDCFYLLMSWSGLVKNQR